MAHDKLIEKRIDALIEFWPNIVKKRMFGGICYMSRGNMCFGIWQDYLIVRADPLKECQYLQREHVRPFDVTGRPMKGWLMVSGQGLAESAKLEEWLETGRSYALTLPEKNKL